jgi:uncharacterized protein YwqG
MAVFFYLNWEYYLRRLVAYLLFIEKVRELMLKTRLFGIAVACAIAMFGLSPATSFAAETDTQTMTLSEKEDNHKGNRALFEEKVNKAIQKWDSLTAAQKDEVYTLLEDELKLQGKILNKLTTLGVIDKKDADMILSERTERMNKMRQSGGFPFYKQRNKRNK